MTRADEIRCDLIAFIKAKPCGRPEDATTVAAKYGMAGMDPLAVNLGLQALIDGRDPREAMNPPMERSE